MPEFAAGELDDFTLAGAEAHLKACSACAAKSELYRRSESALRQPMPMVECPGALDELRLPGRVRVGYGWLRPITAVAIATAVIVVVIMHRMEKPPVAVVKLHPQGVRHVAPHPAKEVSKVSVPSESVDDGPAGKMPAVRLLSPRQHENGHTPHPRPVLAPRPVNENEPKPGVEPEQPAAVAEIPAVQPLDSNPSARILVIASRIERIQPQEIELRSTNSATGETSVYISSRDDAGNEREMSVRSVQEP
jgi:hypothetical protein